MREDVLWRRRSNTGRYPPGKHTTPNARTPKLKLPSTISGTTLPAHKHALPLPLSAGLTSRLAVGSWIDTIPSSRLPSRRPWSPRLLDTPSWFADPGRELYHHWAGGLHPQRLVAQTFHWRRPVAQSFSHDGDTNRGFCGGGKRERAGSGIERRRRQGNRWYRGIDRIRRNSKSKILAVKDILGLGFDDPLETEW